MNKHGHAVESLYFVIQNFSPLLCMTQDSIIDTSIVSIFKQEKEQC